MTQIPPKSWWLYLGGGPAHGEPHMVVLVNNRSVDAWTDYENTPKKQGHTWHGSRADFFQAFEPLFDMPENETFT